jgi:glucose/arabinose dehydrogenase
MRARISQAAMLLTLAACGVAPSRPAIGAVANGAGAQRTAGEPGRPFTVTGRAVHDPLGDGLPARQRRADDQPGAGQRARRQAVAGRRRDRQRQPVGGVPAVKVAGQGGLGDVVAHPGFRRQSARLSELRRGGPNGTSGAAIGYGRLDRACGPGGRPRPARHGFKVIWRQTPKVSGDGHFAHRIAFAPTGRCSSPRATGRRCSRRRTGSDLGKIIHLTAEAGRAARIGGRRPTRMGHRNPLGLAFAPDGRLWSSEMGPQATATSST